MKPTEQTKRHVIAAYVEPARKRGEKRIQVRVGNVQKELGWINRTPSVFSTLSSREFQQEAGVELIEKIDGPPSGGPSTTWQFVFELLDEPKESASEAKPTVKGDGLRSLYGIFEKEFKALGGGEAFLRKERDWGPDAWERYEAEERERQKENVAR